MTDNPAKLYKLSGTYLQQSAIGAMQPFTNFWWAETAKLAMQQLREEFYKLEYDHILFQHVYLCAYNQPNRPVEIPMMEALGLE